MTGDRTKVAVRSHNPNVDAISTIVGRSGNNIKELSANSSKRYDAKAGVEVPVEENIELFNGLKIQLNSSIAIAPTEVDMVLFDEGSGKRQLLFLTTNCHLLSVVVDKRSFSCSFDWLPYRHQICFRI